MATKTKSLSVTYKQMSILTRIGKGDPETGLNILMSKNRLSITDEAEEMEEALQYINSQFVGDGDCKLPFVDVYRQYCDEVLEPLGKMKFKRVLQNNGFTVKPGAQNIVYLFYVDWIDEW